MEYEDWGEVSNTKSKLTYVPVPEERKLQLASGVLVGIFVLFVLSGVVWVFSPSAGEKIFEASKTVLPPIATLVLGYFFSRSGT